MNEIKELPIENIILHSNQPRKSFDETKLQELAQTIRLQGLLQPILVRPIDEGKFQLVCGERRFRACNLACLRTVKAEVRELDDKQVAEIQFIENMHREDLNPIEEAEMFQRMINELGYTHEELGKKICKSREYVTNKLRLLKLPNEVQEKLKSGALTEGHLKAIVSLDSLKQSEIAKSVEEGNLTVRETEHLVRNFNNVPCGTFNENRDLKLLIPVPSRIYAILKDLAEKLKTKPEDLVVKAVLSYVERVKPGKG